MKRFLVCLTVCLMAVGLAASAFAAVELSKHDMVAMAGIDNTFGTLVGTYGVCSACHVPHKAGGAKLWKTAPTGGTDVIYGNLGRLCAYCHDGNLITGANRPIDLSQSVFAAGPSFGGHKMSGLAASNIQNRDATTGLASVLASGLPYTSTLTASNYMECVSCHSVHNSFAARPLLNTKGAPLPAVTGLNDICDACHPLRSSNLMGTANVNGIHPSDINTLDGDNTTPGNSPINLGWMKAVSAGASSTAASAEWYAGPHLSVGGTRASVYCNSCHMVHGSQTALGNRISQTPFGSAILSADDTNRTVADTFCEACHQGSHGNTGSNWPNPGAAATYFHPADNDTTNGSGYIVAVTIPASWVIGGAGQVQCRSCHGVHNNNPEGKTFASSPAIRASGTNNADVKTNFCIACHTGAGASDFDCFHRGHISSTDGSGGTYASMTAPSWAGTPFGTAATMDCYVCHRAHNAAGSRMLRTSYDNVSTPLASTSAPDQVCVDCHTNNPSTYTTAGSATDNASHYVGRPTAATGTTGFPTNGFASADLAFSAQRTNAFKGGVVPVYHQTTGTPAKGTVTCLSCHTGGRTCGSVTAGTMAKTGDAGTTNGNWMIATVSGNLISPADYGSGADNNNRGDGTNTESAYLCTGCHGQNAFVKKVTSDVPGTTHPQATKGDGTAVNGAVYGIAAGFTATYAGTPATLVNCESCHRAHDAGTKSGAYILENNGATNNVIASSNTNPVQVEPVHQHNRFCSSCHQNK